MQAIQCCLFNLSLNHKTFEMSFCDSTNLKVRPHKSKSENDIWLVVKDCFEERASSRAVQNHSQSIPNLNLSLCAHRSQFTNRNRLHPTELTRYRCRFLLGKFVLCRRAQSNYFHEQGPDMEAQESTSMRNSSNQTFFDPTEIASNANSDQRTGSTNDLNELTSLPVEESDSNMNDNLRQYPRIIRLIQLNQCLKSTKLGLSRIRFQIEFPKRFDKFGKLKDNFN